MEFIRQKSHRTHVILFILTLFTTIAAGTLQQGINPFEHPALLWKGIPFSFALLLILGTHEFGHYYMSKRHKVEVTLPYFIPAPSFIGTFGAVIKMKSPMPDRNALLDVGVAGPLAGIVVAVPILVVGLMLSETVPVEAGDAATEGIRLGNCMLFALITWIVHGTLPENVNLVLHPVAFSGWIGLLVTSLNLIPAGQLDGGHIAYALFGSKQKVIARTMLLLLFALAMVGWTGWFIWVLLLLFIGLDHPPVMFDWISLDRKRRVVGWSAFVLFLVTFIPVPF